MSYWPQKYGDPETPENIDYEKNLPPSFSKYFSETTAPSKVVKQSTPPQQPPTFSKYFEQEQPQSFNPIHKLGRLGTQAAIGGIQAATAPFDVAAIAASKLGQLNAPQEFRQNIFEQLNDLLDQRSQGQWDEKSQEKYDYLSDLIKNPQKMEKHLPKEAENFDVGSLIEKGAAKLGVDLTPQDLSEMALRWIGFIKNPSKAQEFIKNGFNPKNVKEVLKALAPTGKETARGLGAAQALEYAAEAELGPIGTMAAMFIGDLAPTLAFGGGKAALQFAKHPVENTKKGLAKGIAAFTPRDKEVLQRVLIEDFRDAGVQADLGTISGNNVIKWVQSTLNQSALTGQPFEEFKKSLTKNIVDEYKKVADSLGKSIHESRYEAGEALKSGLHEARDIDLSRARELYNSAKERAGTHKVFTGNVGKLIQDIEKELEPGSLKSPEQKKVIEVLKEVKNDVLTPEGGIKGAEIRTLINDKIALNDIIDYDVQGGAKKLLGRLVGEIEKAITTRGKEDPQFLRDWALANTKFGLHAKLFRGRTLANALKTQDPSLLFSKMDTPHGTDQIKKALSVSPEGRELFKNLARYKLDEMIGKNMVDGITNQMKFGTFAKLLEKGQNRQVVKQLLGSDGLRRLEKIQKASGHLAETAQKFLNSSRSGVHASDLAYAAKVMYDVGNAIGGNPWPLMESVGGLTAAKTVSRWITDPEFLQMFEDVILETEKGTPFSLQKASLRLAEKAKSLEKSAKASAISGGRQNKKSEEK